MRAELGLAGGLLLLDLSELRTLGVARALDLVLRELAVAVGVQRLQQRLDLGVDRVVARLRLIELRLVGGVDRRPGAGPDLRILHGSIRIQHGDGLRLGSCRGDEQAGRNKRRGEQNLLVRLH